MLPNAVPDHIQARLADYARLLRVDRPIGSLLLLWPTYWALWLAADGFPSVGNFIVFTPVSYTHLTLPTICSV